MRRLQILVRHLRPTTTPVVRLSQRAMSSPVPYTSEACCQISPVNSAYQPKGEKIKLGKYDEVYAVGDKSSSTVVINIFDIFGFYPQTQQGADIIAEKLGARVLMPDFFFGKPYPLDQFPAKTEEQKKFYQNFFATTASFGNVMPGLLDLAKELREQGATKVFVYGFCWGGKVATLSGCKTTEVDGKTIPIFDAVAAIHPAMMSAEDGKHLLVPIAIFPSGDESVDEYKKLIDELKTKPWADKNAYRVYSNMHHGWAAARADLDNEDNNREYMDVYGRLVTFFQNA